MKIFCIFIISNEIVHECCQLDLTYQVLLLTNEGVALVIRDEERDDSIFFSVSNLFFF